MSYTPKNPNGQATMANSSPVVLASDQTDVKITLDGEAVSVTSSALPTGASTSANQTTIIGHLDGVEGLLTTIDADTSNISTKIDTLAGAVAGTEMQVDVLTMPTVTVTATNLDVQSGGADLATSTQAGAIQTAVELIDDTVYTDGVGTVTKGIAILGQDGTNPQAIKTDASGELQVDVLTMPTTTVTATDLDIRDLSSATDSITIVPSGTQTVSGTVTIQDGGNTITVDNGGTFATQATLQAGTAYAGKVRLTDGTTDAEVVPLTGYNAQAVAIVDGSGNQITAFGGGTQYTESDTDASITGTAMLMEGAADTLLPVQGTVADGLLVNLGANNDVTITGTVAVTQSGTWDEVGINDSGNSITVDDGGTSLTVDGSVSITGSVDTELPTAAALADNTANPTLPSVGSFPHWYDGSTWDRAPGTSADGLLVNLGTNNDVTVTGTVTANLAAGTNNIGDVDVLSIVPGTGATNLGKAIDTATGATDTGVLALATRDDTLATLTPADSDNVQLRTDSEGALWVTLKPNTTGGASTMNASSSDGATALTSTAQAIKASAGTLKGYYIYNPNSSAQFVQFYNTASGSVTVGTTSPLFMLTIPATSGANLWMPDGINFSTAISWAATSTAGGNGAPTTALDAVAWYK